jgi:hypothetical protein
MKLSEYVRARSYAPEAQGLAALWQKKYEAGDPLYDNPEALDLGYADWEDQESAYLACYAEHFEAFQARPPLTKEQAVEVQNLRGTASSTSNAGVWAMTKIFRDASMAVFRGSGDDFEEVLYAPQGKPLAPMTEADYQALVARYSL